MAADKAQPSNFSLTIMILEAHGQHSLPAGSEENKEKRGKRKKNLTTPFGIN